MMERKRKVLIVDDQKVNLAILSRLLSPAYDILTAENGSAALDLLERCGDELSAVLLDVIMPGMSGYDVLAQIRQNARFKKLPVIVVTQPDGSNDDELKALELGATDFATKPYNGKVLQRRLQNMIDLRETSEYAKTVEKDPLTGLLNAEAFAHSVTMMLEQNPDVEYDLICSDIERFKLVNDLFGKAQGDNVLCYVADIYRENDLHDCVYGRVSGDVFGLLMPSCRVSEKVLKNFTSEVAKYPLNITLALKSGICRVDDRHLPASVLCDRAILAADSIKGLYDRYVAYYDDGMREKMLREQFIIDNMRPALANGQFEVFLQPKYGLAHEKVAGAEALVRWLHPEMGFMSPGEFIPLFESNGFITELDMFVWDKTCEYIREWINTYGTYVPVSVNVSRVDICNPDLPKILLDTLNRHDIEPCRLHLEVTETAYTENSQQIIETVGLLKGMGFAIEMDDFGSGYSSLNMLSELPINILKLDMKLVQRDLVNNGSRSIVSFIISLAKWMNLLVVAEDVETHEQLSALRSMNCNYVQGYYYAKPMPEKEFIKYFEAQQTIIDDMLA
ncbi:MAG: EAL domain-containing response regulator [Clostridia bacterium]|nr:EAL domain-containing response regulator [Clostridia bacterium]NLS86145.1 EAL domain-containing protein [Oscillospiraceae bacterium]